VGIGRHLGLAVEVLAEAAGWWVFVGAALGAGVVELDLIGEAKPVVRQLAPELAPLAEALAVTRRSVPLTLALEPVGTPAEVSGESLLVDGQRWTAAALTSPKGELTDTVSVRADLSMRPQTVVQLALAAASHQRRLVLVVPSGVRPPPSPSDPHDADEDLAQAAIKQVVMHHVAEVRACYERELKHRPGLEGRVVVTFSIGPDGRAGEVEVDETLPDDDAVSDCVAARVETWRFPKPTSGEPIEVRYPFVFTPER
jgi:TonB family protein